MVAIYEAVDPAVTTVAARTLLATEDQRANRNDILANWFPLLEVNRLKYVGLRPPLRTYTEAAPYRAFDTPAPLGTRPGVAWFTGSMPPISIKYPWGELDEHQMAALLSDTESPISRGILQREITDDVTRGVRAIRNRMMAAAAELLVNGTLVIDENGLNQLTVNSGRAANRTATAAIAWSNTATAVPIDNERAMLQVLRDEADLYPEDLVVMTDQATYDEWLATEQVRETWDSVRILPSLSEEQGAELRGRHNLPPVLINDKKIRGVGQSSGSQIIPTGNWIYLPRNEFLGNTQYGRTAIASMGQVNLRNVAPEGIVSYVTYSVDPAGMWTVVDGLGIPTFTAPDLTAVLSV